jgi:signal transduction histidine kinase
MPLQVWDNRAAEGRARQWGVLRPGGVVFHKAATWRTGWSGPCRLRTVKHMTSGGIADTGRPGARTGRAPGAAGRLAAPRSVRSWLRRAGWRPTAHLLAGAPAAASAAAVLSLIVIVWAAAIYASATDFTSSGSLIVLYLFFVFAAPVPLLVTVRESAVLQRARFRAVLGAEIPAPPPTAGFWLRPWLVVTTWRQVAYHLLAPVFSAIAVVVVGLCWLALPLAIACWVAGPPALAAALTVAAVPLLLVAPPIAAALAQADAGLGRLLLGPRTGDVLAERVKSLTRSRDEAVAAADAERRRIERDLHDGTQQRLVSLGMHLGMALVTLPEDTRPAIRAVIEEAREEVIAINTELREFVRGLLPAVINDRGLDAALSGLCAKLPMPTDLEVDIPVRCSPRIEATAYFVVSEALNNVVKHSDSHWVAVGAVRQGDKLVVHIEDGGQGGVRMPTNPNSGLRGLAQRVTAVDGTFQLRSPVGEGTLITVELPCES